jgi:MFS family permease
MPNKYNKNIKLIHALNFCRGLSYGWAVIFVLFLRSFSLSFTQVSILLGVLFLANLIFEVPSGEFADLYGRKKSIIIYGFSSLIINILFIITNSFWVLLLAMIVNGVGLSLWTGTNDSLLFESLKITKKEKDYQKHRGLFELFYVSIGILTNFFMPLLFNQNIRIPFYIALLFSIVFIILANLIYDPYRVKKHKITFKTYHKQLKQSLTIIKKNNKIFMLFFYTVILYTIIKTFSELINQPLIAQNFNLSQYGLIFALATVVQALLLLIANKIINFFRKIHVYIMLALVWSLSLALLTTKSIYVIIPVMGVTWFMGTLVAITFSTDLNHNLKQDNKRATVLSLHKFFSSLGGILFVLVFGFIMDKFNINNSVYILSAIGIIFILVTSIFKKKK